MRRRRRASRGTVRRPTSFAIDLETKIFDHRVGEQRLAHFFCFVARFRGGTSLDFEQNIFADFDARDVFKTKTDERAFDRSSLRIEDSFSRRDENSYLQLKSFYIRRFVFCSPELNMFHVKHSHRNPSK